MLEHQWYQLDLVNIMVADGTRLSAATLLAYMMAAPWIDVENQQLPNGKNYIVYATWQIQLGGFMGNSFFINMILHSTCHLQFPLTI